QPAKDTRHRLHRDPSNIVERLLTRQINARGLAVKFEAPRPRIGGTEAVARQPRPDAAAGSEFGDLLEEADGDVEEEGKARQHLIRVPAARQAVIGVLDGGG